MSDDIKVRKVTPDDDFSQIRELILSTKKRFYYDPRLSVICAEELKDSYTNLNLGFVAEKNDRIVGFMGLTLGTSSPNGYLEYGVAENQTVALKQMIQSCCNAIQLKKGNKLYYFATMPFGQVRNQEITLLEQHGFISDEYSQISTHFHLPDWKEPENLNTDGIVPLTNAKKDDIVTMLIEDGEELQAEQFSKQYSNLSSEAVLLSMFNSYGQIAGFAYYKVKALNPSNNDLSAVAFGIHFRANVSKADKKRLIQAALLSMRQFNIIHVNSMITLKKFDNFVLMVREGFDDYMANTLRLKLTI
ncbi:hypothetical protein DVH26_20365 [Paenibacillus sp. H1-7]|uniref:hypothetical protein n=1 Tax=Paenibacillus sp. H1-7 TaxID=2282849 RepID=UPI001EF80D45|nr:hypothetical protein [Paenibacillus sp. H1-7]ULL16590.1 hypothetical protein DVH26_20365 [Paenibacillus sp. H1-7]